MRKARKVLCILMTAIMIISSMSMLKSNNVYADSLEDKVKQYEYRITSEESFYDLINILNDRNFSYKYKYNKIFLEKDIQLTNGYDELFNTLYKGMTFDGQGHCISGRKISVTGLFKENEGTIKNLKLQDFEFSPELTDNFGGIACKNRGTISNCHLSNVVINAGGNYTHHIKVGGIAAYSDGTIRNCTFSGKITSNATEIGGIVGRDEGSIENCANFGKVESLGGGTGDSVNTRLSIGGICGIGYEVCNCYSVGEISTGEVKKTSGFSRYVPPVIGGIAGRLDNKGKYIYSINENNIGESKAFIVNSQEKLSSSYMQSQEFINTLNSYTKGNMDLLEWDKVSGSYPTPIQKEVTVKVAKTTINTVYAGQTLNLGISTTGIDIKDLKVTNFNQYVLDLTDNNTVRVLRPGFASIGLYYGGSEKYKSTSVQRITIYVKPAKVKGIKVVSKSKKKVTVSWKKTKCSGYIVQYSTDKRFKKNVKTVKINSETTTKTNLTRGLKKNKVYYVRVIASQSMASVTLKSTPSAVKKFKVK